MLIRSLLLTITQNPMEILEKIKGKILLDGSYLTWWVAFCGLSNKISPLMFSIIFIGFWVIVSNKLWVINKMILYVTLVLKIPMFIMSVFTHILVMLNLIVCASPGKYISMFFDICKAGIFIPGHDEKQLVILSYTGILIWS